MYTSRFFPRLLFRKLHINFAFHLNGRIYATVTCNHDLEKAGLYIIARRKIKRKLLAARASEKKHHLSHTYLAVFPSRGRGPGINFPQQVSPCNAVFLHLNSSLMWGWEPSIIGPHFFRMNVNRISAKTA